MYACRALRRLGLGVLFCFCKLLDNVKLCIVKTAITISHTPNRYFNYAAFIWFTYVLMSLWCYSSSLGDGFNNFILTHRSNESEGWFYIRWGPWSYERSCWAQEKLSNQEVPVRTPQSEFTFRPTCQQVNADSCIHS